MQMENYSYQSYPDSGDSSPRSREIDFENPPTTIPWDDQQQLQQQSYKVKFMCSYGGKIQPRTHDNQLSYVGGETKILAVDRNIKFPLLISKLCSLIEAPDVSFKYQLPGEDLDALISVTNDDDLDHMMHEYDRLSRASARPARMRLFLFVNDSTPSSNPPDPIKPANVDYLFGIEKPVTVTPPPAAVKFHDPVPEPVAPLPEFHPRQALNPSDRVTASDPGLNHQIEIQRQLQRMQIAAENEQTAYRRKSEDNFVGNYSTGDYYVQKVPEKFPVSNFSAPQQHQPGYWQEKPVPGEAYPPVAPGGGDQPVYMVPAPGNYYNTQPVMRPPVTQGYYAVQRMPSDSYRETQVYGGAPPSKAPFSSGMSANYAPAQPVKGPAYAEGVSVVRSTGIPDNSVGSYAQVAYDSASGRQVYYTAPGGVVHAPPYQGVAAPVTTDVKGMSKISQGSV
ncbi:uncharacterized protein [Cicer arietinum]|uniref:Uncharacterized protein LOC101503649 n=1 Tax=Cicer arietinum TaxID=3827 RepID=A0A1S2XC29_CICAR|nr:uncharacterized protein LOC101503649 [Cicer arietinum]